MRTRLRNDMEHKREEMQVLTMCILMFKWFFYKPFYYTIMLLRGRKVGTAASDPYMVRQGWVRG